MSNGALSVEFKTAYCRDMSWPQSLEDAMRRTMSLAGIHETDFQNAINEDFSGSDPFANWTAGTQDCIPAQVSEQMKLTGNAASAWGIIYHSQEIAPGLIASFDLVDGNGAFFFKKADGDDRCWMAWWNDTQVGISYNDTAGQEHPLIKMPLVISKPARIQVMGMYSLDSVDDDRKWILISMFVNGFCYVGASYDVGTTTLDWDGNGLGFAVYDSGTEMTVDNFTVSELTRIVPWVSVDVGEPCATGMGRSIQSTRVKVMARYDGTVRVWRPRNRDLDWDLQDRRSTQIQDRSNQMETLTHVRGYGAMYESDYFDDDEGEAHMHRFQVHNDPNVMTEEETYYEAYRVVHDAKEEQELINIICPPMPMVEPFDRIRYNGSDYRVMSIATQVQMAQQGPQMRQIIQCRRYLDIGTPPDRM